MTERVRSQSHEFEMRFLRKIKAVTFDELRNTRVATSPDRKISA